VNGSLFPRHLYWLIAAQAVAVITLFWVLPGWLGLFWLLLALWRLQMARRNWSPPAGLLKLAVIAAGIAGWALSFQLSFTLESFAAFFLLSFSLKMIELIQQRDGMLFIWVSFIALAINFLFYQTLPMALWTLLALTVILAAWQVLYRSRNLSPWQELKTSSLWLLQALPLMVILFITLPRLGPLWFMPTQSSVGQTGFSDQMRPGSISELVQSDAIAFRVSFDGTQPNQDSLYWRGLVLDRFDGETWSQGGFWPGFNPFAADQNLLQAWDIQPQPTSQRLSYSVLLEPHQQTSLFSLMAPVEVDSARMRMFYTPQATLSSRIPIASRTQYRVVSQTGYRYAPDGLDDRERRINLTLPAGGNMQSRAWAEELRSRYGEGNEADAAIMSAVLDQYNASFRYSLKTTIANVDSVDHFMFDSQTGFCEHFASSFVFLMRAAGIPARVVVGYLGGEYNPEQNYYIVRQRDAHAWTEVWQPGLGWQQVDPTAAVAPQRIMQNITDALDAEDAALLGGPRFSAALMNWIIRQADAINYDWQRLIVNYDEFSQMAFFSELLGSVSPWKIGVFFAATCGLVLGLYALTAYWRKRLRLRGIHLADRYYRQLLFRLGKAGVVITAGDTPSRIAQRVAKAFPASELDIMGLTNAYHILRYGNLTPSPSDLDLFQQQCRRFSLK